MKSGPARLIFVIFVLLCPAVLGDGPEWEWHITDLNQSKFLELNLVNTTALLDLDNNVTRVGYEYECQYKGQATIPGCFDRQTGNGVIDSTYSFGQLTNAIKIVRNAGGPERVGITQGRSRTIVFMLDWGGSNSGSGGTSLLTQTDDATFTEKVGVDAGDQSHWHIDDQTVGDRETLRRTNDATRWGYLSVDNINARLVVSNFTDYSFVPGRGTAVTFTDMQVNALSADTWYNLFQTWLQNPTVNTSANVLQWNLSLATDTDTWLVNVSAGDDSHVLVNISCDEGATWDDGAVNTSITCSSGSTTSPILQIHFTNANGNATDFWISPGGVGPPSGVVITLIDTYDSIALQNFTVTIFNATDTFTNETSTGSITFDNIISGVYNINITKINDSGGYFNQSFSNIDVSSAFEANAFQSVVRLRAFDGFNNNTILDFSAVTNLSSDSTTNGLIFLLIKKGIFSLNVTASGFDELITNFSMDALENVSLNLTIGSIFNFNLIRESTGDVFDFNATNQTTLNIFCPNQTIQIFFNTSSNATQIITCRFDLMQMTVDYGALGSYFRTLIPPLSQKNITWYLIDVKKGDIAIQRIIRLLDLTREFTNAKLSVTRAVAGVVRTIIEQRFDISNNVNLFLIQNELYSISIDNGVSTTILGNLIPTEAGTQTITLPKIDFVPQETILGDNISWSYSLNVTTNVLRMQYLDKVEKTTFVKFTVFNETNAQLFSGESTDTSDVTITFNQAFANRTYSTELFFIHPDLSNHTDKKVFYGIGDTSSGALELQGWTPTEQRDIKKWVAYIFLIVWVLIFSSVHSGLAIATMTIWLWMFRLWQWVEVSGIIFGFLILIGVVAWIVEAMRKN